MRGDAVTNIVRFGLFGPTHRMPAMMPANPAPIHTTLIRRCSSTEKSGLVDGGVDVDMDAGEVRRWGWTLWGKNLSACGRR